jgi:hypothetical protein
LTNVVTVTVHVVTGGGIGGNQTICKEGDPVAFTQTTASTGNSVRYQWESSIDNSTFSEVAGQTSALYDVGAPLSQTTYYRRKTSSAANPCTALSNTVIVTVNSVTPGTISGNQTICNGADPLVFSEASSSSASGSYSYQWQNSTDNNTFTDIGGATTAMFDSPPGLAVTTYFRRIIIGVENGLICSDKTNTLTVTVNAVTAGTISGDQNYCVVSDPAPFTETSGGTGQSLAFEWQNSVDNIGFTNISGQNGVTYDVPSVLTQTTYYRRKATGNVNGVECSAISNSLTVVINPVGPGMIAGPDPVICNGGDPAIFTETTASQAPGVIEYEWQSVLVSGGSFAPIGVSDKFYDIPNGLIHSTRYRRLMKSTVNNFTCSAMSNVWTITINRVTAGTIAPSLTSMCNGGDPGTMGTGGITPGGSGTISFKWQSSYDNVNFNQVASATNVAYNPPAGFTQTTHFQRITVSTMGSSIGPVPCTSVSNTATIALNNVTPGSIAGDQTICAGGNPAIFTNVQPGSGSNLSYEWRSSINNSTFTVISGETGATCDLSGSVAQTTYYRRVAKNLLNNFTCYAPSNTITVSTLSVVAVTASNKSVCSGWVVPLTGSPAGGTWSGTGVSGSTFNSVGLTTGNYTVTYSIVNSNGCASSANATVTVSPVPVITGFTGTSPVCKGRSYTYSVAVSGTGYTYSWVKPTSWVIEYQSGNTIRLYVPTNNTQYGAVTVTVSNGTCTASNGTTTYPAGTACIQQFSTTISPNPANMEMTLELASEEEADVPVTVYSQVGGLMKRTSIVKGTGKVTIDTSGLPNGVYLVVVKQPKGETEFKRVIVSH